MGILAAAIPGLKHDRLCFHTSMPYDGLTNQASSPAQFVKWLEALIEEWDFDNLATAHNGVLVGNAKLRLKELLEDSRTLFDKLTEDRLNGKVVGDTDDAMKKGAWSKDMTENNCECG